VHQSWNRSKIWYISELNDLYSTENLLLKAIPKIARQRPQTHSKKPLLVILNRPRCMPNDSQQYSTNWEQARRGKSARQWKAWVKEGAEKIEEDAEPEVKECMADRRCSACRALRNGGIRLRATLCRIIGRDRGC
jgi:hypothetical protein